ncbi:uncharacterized protein LOC105907195 [Clupea harengus]|uniref:Uncharacterized protein LOC105907195 n=1 Tax=Clupea harengus TaxID=7950 RepID=A0A6P8GQD1_CLUHA|nr:uncharacterized protein LOC105907195 [Clupea harengus]
MLNLASKAIGANGQFPITTDGGAQCGYSYSVYPMLAHAVLQASYFSCYTQNEDDLIFTFNFHLIMIDNDEEVVHNITKTCSPSHIWSHREVTCEKNYMEVSVQTDLPCPHTHTLTDVELASALPMAQEAATSAWQIMFLRQGEEPVVMSVHEAEDLGYFLAVTPGRVVFRTAYGQQHSTIGMVSGLAVEVIRPAVFLRQRLTTMMVDLVAACTLDDHEFHEGALIWKTPTVMVPLVSDLSGFRSKQVDFDVNGKRLDPQMIEERGYTVDVGPEIVEVSIPYAAEGGTRKTFVMDNTYHEFYSVTLHYEHIFTTDNGTLENRLCQHTYMATPVLCHTLFTIDLTVLEDRVFTVYVGNFPFDVELVSVSLNGMVMTVPDATQNGYQVSKVPHDNDTYAYTVLVPFEDPIVSKLYFVEGVREYSLNINYTLCIWPQEEYYFYLATVVAQIMDVYPPYFNGLCMEDGIKFRIDHQEFDHLWEAGVGPFPLTQELADTRGYIMTNDNQSLTLDVPLFTLGYMYEAVSLEQFLATFEILIRDAKSLEVVQSSAKTCQFATTALLVCSPDGIMTVVCDLSKAKPDAFPSQTSLLDKTCKPKEVDETRVLYEFALNSCGTRVQITKDDVIYENEITFEESFTPEEKPVITRDSPYRVIVRCIYPIYAIDQLFGERTFQSQTPGLGTLQIEKPLLEKPLLEKPLLEIPLVKKPLIEKPLIKKPLIEMPLKTPVTVPPKVETTTTTPTALTSLATKSPSTQRPAKYVQVFSWSYGAERKTVVQPSKFKGTFYLA